VRQITATGETREPRGSYAWGLWPVCSRGPQRVTTVSSALAEAPMTSEQSQRQTVLLVDDDAMLRSLLARALADEGYAVLIAENGEQALTLVTTLDGQLGLVVTDIRMPVMNGLELAAQLACLHPSLPVLFISGFTNDRYVPGPVLDKPFTPSAFVQQVARMLPRVQHL
jgi:two-component system cell cycle sensor histidine kinase/response regulator CckA